MLASARASLATTPLDGEPKSRFLATSKPHRLGAFSSRSRRPSRLPVGNRPQDTCANWTHTVRKDNISLKMLKFMKCRLMGVLVILAASRAVFGLSMERNARPHAAPPVSCTDARPVSVSGPATADRPPPRARAAGARGRGRAGRRGGRAQRRAGPRQDTERRRGAGGQDGGAGRRLLRQRLQGAPGQVHAGMEEAGKVAGIVSEDLADSVSALVSNHLSADDADEDLMMKREGIVDGFLRMVGIEPSRVGLMALNVLIFLAEMITSTLIGEDLNAIPDTRSHDGASPLAWLLSGNPFQVDAMLREAQDPGLPRTIIEKLQRATGEKTACVQLLVCKMSPVVWGIQRSVKEAVQPRHLDPDAPERGVFQMLYDSLPELDAFVNFSESCEHQFPSCPLLSLSDLRL
nr:uncharacterized protein LOC113823102 [Penaeus vannamei]